MAEKLYTEENSKYLTNNPTWHSEDSEWKALHILKLLNRNNIIPETVVEVGCGVGQILYNMQKALPSSKKITGYDISSDAINLAVKLENDRLQFFKGNFIETTDNFDLLLMIDVFEHVDDYLGFLKACKKRAKNFVFHIPLDISVQSVLRKKLIHERKSVGHIHYFTKETALETIKDSGYKIQDYFYTSATIDLPVQTWKSKMAVLPRKLLFKLNQDLAARVLGGFSLMVLAE